MTFTTDQHTTELACPNCAANLPCASAAAQIRAVAARVPTSNPRTITVALGALAMRLENLGGACLAKRIDGVAVGHTFGSRPLRITEWLEEIAASITPAEEPVALDLLPCPRANW